MIRLDVVGLQDTQTWTAPTLLNGWTNWGSGANPAGHMLTAQGVVRIRGLVMSGGNIGVSNPIFVLPVGRRPLNFTHCAAITYGSAAFVYIQPNGEVSLYSLMAGGTLAAGNWLSLDGITFTNY